MWWWGGSHCTGYGVVAGGGESDETVSSHLDSIITFHACFIPGAKDASPERMKRKSWPQVFA